MCILAASVLWVDGSGHDPGSLSSPPLPLVSTSSPGDRPSWAGAQAPVDRSRLSVGSSQYSGRKWEDWTYNSWDPFIVPDWDLAYLKCL